MFFNVIYRHWNQRDKKSFCFTWCRFRWGH